LFYVPEEKNVQMFSAKRKMHMFCGHTLDFVTHHCRRTLSLWNFQNTMLASSVKQNEGGLISTNFLYLFVATMQ
jgi:hypothetical protein